MGTYELKEVALLVFRVATGRTVGWEACELQRAFSKLSPAEQRMLYGVCGEQRTIADAERTYGITPKTGRRILDRGLVHLHGLLEG